MLKFTERSIFFKIYAGLLLICVSAIFFSYWFIDIVNKARIQSYRQHVVAGTFYLIGEALGRQPKSNRQAWLKDLSTLFGDSFSLMDSHEVAFKAKEIRQLKNHQAVVRRELGDQFSVYYMTNFDDTLLYVKITQIGDRQVRAMTTLLYNDLMHYPTLGAKQARLRALSDHLGYPVSFLPLDSLGLDSGQFARVATGDTVMAFYDGAANQNSTLLVIAPSGLKNIAIVAGPIELFYWFPFHLLLSTAVLALLLIAFGLYVLIYPLEKRLKLIQVGVNEVAKGKLDTKVQVLGHDDIAKLSATFNAMTSHIKRLIDSQRELTRAVSHELRTPVARIRFAVDILADTDDARSREEQLQEIDADIESLNELIDEMLTYAKLEEGSPKLDWQMVNLRQLVLQVVKETNALGKPIEVRCNLPAAKINVMADRRYLHRVLQNFAGNALRYAKTTIMISAWTDKEQAFVGVEDDGAGIAKENREKVFAAFTRLDDSRTAATGGYGLGLSIVSRIAFWFHGEVKLGDSPTLGGAKFVMSWPTKQVGSHILADEGVQAANAKLIIGE